MALTFKHICRGAILETTQPHFEAVIPVDTNEPTSYVGRWDVSRTTNDSVRAYLTGSAKNYELHFYGYGASQNWTRSTSAPYSNAPYASYTSQIKKLVVHDGVTDLGMWTLRYPDGLSGVTLTISNTVRYLRQYCFEGIYQSSFSIPAGVRVLAPAPIYVNSTSATINFPNTINRIDYKAVVSPTQSWLEAQTSSGSYKVVGDGCLLWGRPTGTVWTIPAGVKSVNCAAWNNATNVTAVNLPSTTKFLSTGAFARYSSLQKMKLPQGTERIYGQSFQNCTSLTKVWIPRSVWLISSSGGNNTVVEAGSPPFSGANANLTIYCEIDSSEIPETWASNWNIISGTTPATVVWNYPEPGNDW